MHFLHEYREILSDPAHGAAEMTYFLLELDLLLLSPLILRARNRWRRALRREHAVIDAEYGIVHPEPLLLSKTKTVSEQSEIPTVR